MEKLEIDFSPVRGRKLLVALSGGADSVALLALLREWSGCALVACHFEHGIRGEASLADADFCRDLCAKWSVEYHQGGGDVPAAAKRRGVGLETAARELRYQYLRETRLAVGADYIALAHHLDDQAETVLMHLCRGAGSDGLSGMRPVSGDLFRPLLRVPKAALVRYLQSRGIAWREDDSNRIADTPRNRLRLEILPALTEIWPGAPAALGRCADLAGEDADCLRNLAGQWLRDHGETGPYGTRIRCRELPHPAILRRALRQTAGVELDARQTEALLRLCIADRGSVQLPDGFRAEKAADALYIQPPPVPPPAEARLLIPGTTALEGICRLSAEIWAGEIIRRNGPEQTLDREALAGAVLRTRREGDKIRPLGMRGMKLLSDYLTDRRVARPLRDTLPLVACGEHVLWVVGVGISDDAAAREDRAMVRLRAKAWRPEWKF